MDIKELFYEADTRKHQQAVQSIMIAVAQKIIQRAVVHDASKLESPEREYYIDPVYTLTTEEVAYDSDRYKELVARMDKGWEHHRYTNDHHPEFFEPYAVQTLNDPVKAMDMFALIEMLCDWIAASQRKNNKPVLALAAMLKKYHVEEQLEAVLRNTLYMIECSINKD